MLRSVVPSGVAVVLFFFLASLIFKKERREGFKWAFSGMYPLRLRA